MSAATRALTTAAALALAACTSVTTARISADDLQVGEGLEPVAAIQADATSAYLLLVPIPGVDLDDAIRRVIARAKLMGADKIADLRFRITPDGGVWSLRKLLGWRSARASAIAVKVLVDPPDAEADQGPEPPGTSGVGAGHGRR